MKSKAAIGRFTLREEARIYGTVTQNWQTLGLDSLLLGICAVTAIRCLPDSKASGGLVAVIPFTAPLAFGGRGMVKS